MGQFLSKPHQAQTAFWQFQFSCKQPRSCEMIQKIPKILDMPIYIYFRLNIFVNVITWKKKPNSCENLDLYTLDSSYKLISCINWIACFLVTYTDFLNCSEIRLRWGYISYSVSIIFCHSEEIAWSVTMRIHFPWWESLIHSRWGFWSRGHYANCIVICTEIVVSSETNISTNFCGSTNNFF